MSFIYAPPPQPLIISDEALMSSSIITTTLAANTVYLYAFELAVPTAFSGGKWEMGATSTGVSDIGIYDVATGSLQVHLASAFSNVLNSQNVASFAATFTCPPGQWWMAFATSLGTDNVRAAAPTASTVLESRARKATNGATIGVLPPTLGAILAPTGKHPAVMLTVVGGI